MQITRTSPFSGVERTRDLDVTPAQMLAWQNGACIQDVMPHLSRDDCEFIMTGISPDEWEASFAK